MRAAEYGHVQCLEELAKAKADMRCKDLEGKGKLTDSHNKVMCENNNECFSF